MNYIKIGEKIRYIREHELKKSREEFAEEIGISIHTATRLENATNKVSNIETFVKVSEITGYTLDELILDNNSSQEIDKNKRKIIHLLNSANNNELEYIYNSIKEFLNYIDKNTKKN